MKFSRICTFRINYYSVLRISVNVLHNYTSIISLKLNIFNYLIMNCLFYNYILLLSILNRRCNFITTMIVFSTFCLYTRVHIRAESCAQFVNAPALTRFDYANPRVRRIHNGEKTREIKMRDATREGDEAMCRGIIAKFKRDRVYGRATFREQTGLWYAKSIEVCVFVLLCIRECKRGVRE